MDGVLCGRELEQRRIGHLVDEARAGRGGALVLRGPAGVGKTTLLGDVPASLRACGVEAEVELAFSGLHQLLGPVLGRLGDLPDVQADALRRALGLAAGETTDLLVCAAVCALLRAAEPLVVVVDDAQNVDRASVRALLFASRRLHDSRVAMFFGVRDPDVRGLDTAGLPELTVSGLDETAAAKLLPGLAPATLAVLVRATGGNPLALRELEPDHALLNALVTGTVPVGEALRAAFVGRISALPEASQDALLVAAAESGGRLETVLAACAELGLPAEATDALGRFSHPLARSSIYSAASRERRQRAHGALSKVETGAAARWHRALAAGTADETLAAELEADAADAGSRGGVGAAVSVLAEAARLSGTAEARSRRLAAAAHAAWKSGHTDLARSFVARTTPDEVTDRTLARLRGLIELYSGDQVTAFEQLSRASKSLWDKAPEQAADLAFMAADAAVHAGLLDEAVALAGTVVDLGPDPGYQDFGRWLAGWGHDVPEPWQVFDSAPAAVRGSGAHRWLVPMAISVRGPHLRQAREFGLAAVADLRERGMLAIHAVPLYWLAETEYRLGLWDEGIAHAEESLRAARDAGQRPGEANAHAVLALFAAGRGAAAVCRGHAANAVEIATAVRDRLAAARATWALALLDEGLGDQEAADERVASLSTPGLPQAHELVSRQAAQDNVEHPFERARVALRRGQELRRNKQVSEARVLLRLAVELFDGLGAAPWSERARMELRACGAVSGPAENGALTPQEWEVARLAAAGLSNREIGARLFLSHRTVGYHLYKIFPKLGVARRSQLRSVPVLRSGDNVEKTEATD
ncbi:helix-turn-helix transcriptional regulator [Allokutzneria oryzae]|uniref:AAA family ATPase n=1 Tax=Allokutzneria oryzae TaxID=1378989 RepID=A0ABV6A898_9PSEU